MGSLEEEAKEEVKKAGQRLRKLIIAEGYEKAGDDTPDVAVTLMALGKREEDLLYSLVWCL